MNKIIIMLNKISSMLAVMREISSTLAVQNKSGVPLIDTKGCDHSRENKSQRNFESLIYAKT